jgi:ectoine hydroxylase-related dioxygenase (phytanoyl-CoA dioxygenase family)
MNNYEQDGYMVARQLFRPDEIDLIRDTFMAQAANGPVQGLSEFKHRGRDAYDPKDPLAFYPRMMHPHRHLDKPVGPLAMKYMLDPRIGNILRELFGEEPLAAQSMFYFKPPGARGQGLHQDNFYLRVKPGTCMAAWIAIDDSDEGNGGMVLVPGTHKMEIVCPEKADSTRFFTTEWIPVPEGKREVPAELKAGDVLFFNGSVIHGSYPNESKDRFRRSLICHYVPQSTAEMSAWYQCMRFDQTPVPLKANPDGGPCGTLALADAPH